MSEQIRRTTGISIWRQLSDRLRDLIDSGSLAAGDRLPSEAELALRHGVNRHTVRAALADLSRAGLVQTEQGRGTFVCATQRLIYPVGQKTRFSAGLDGQSEHLTTMMLSSDEEPADARQVDALACPAGTLLMRVETVSFADHLPLSRATHWFPAMLLPGIADRIREGGSITRALEGFGMGSYTRATTRITARRASARDADLLRIPDSSPLLVVEAVNTHDGQPIQYSRTRFAADRIELSLSS